MAQSKTGSTFWFNAKGSNVNLSGVVYCTSGDTKLDVARGMTLGARTFSSKETIADVIAYLEANGKDIALGNKDKPGPRFPVKG